MSEEGLYALSLSCSSLFFLDFIPQLPQECLRGKNDEQYSSLQQD